MADRSIEVWGETFDLADKIGLMPLMRFGHLAKAGVDADDMEALDAMFTLLQQCFTEAAWDRFVIKATENRAEGDELMGIVAKAMGAMAARPTGRPSTPSDGSHLTSVKSVDASSSPVIDRLVEEGRPDIALAVHRAQQWSATA